MEGIRGERETELEHLSPYSQEFPALSGFPGLLRLNELSKNSPFCLSQFELGFFHYRKKKKALNNIQGEINYSALV